MKIAYAFRRCASYPYNGGVLRMLNPSWNSCSRNVKQKQNFYEVITAQLLPEI